jgi:hypothetical protein
MNKTVAGLILLLWIGTTLCLDLTIALFSLPIVANLPAANDGIPYYERQIFTDPLLEVVSIQVVISLVFLAFGIVWSGIVLLATERILRFLKFPMPPANKFSILSLNLFKIALSSAIFTFSIANICTIYDQIQGRSHIRF